MSNEPIEDLSLQQVHEIVLAQDRAERHFTHLRGKLVCKEVKVVAPRLARQLLKTMIELERRRTNV